MTGRTWWRRSVKALHQISAIAGGGGLAACLVIGLTANAASQSEFIGARQAIAAIARFVLVPSLAVVLVTGLLAIAATRAYHDAGWAWVKALLGLSVFEATLLTVGASVRQAELAAAAADPGLLASLLHSERNTLWLLLALSVANVVLAVWRPRLTVKIR
ncbi:MAG: hypothetical protein K8R60_02890 [Burkholderiales bacterium]|nr:hypothetical protein [Burkholderiales bacterium]